MKKRLSFIMSVAAASAALAVQPALAACSGKGVSVSHALGIKDDCVGADGTNPIFALVSYAIQFLIGIFGLILVLMIVIAGLQYILSGTSPDAAKDAKDRLKNAATGLVLFVLMWGALQVLLPDDVKVFRG